MTFDDFTAFVAHREAWYRHGFPEAEETLAEAERTLGISLPYSLKWLLREFGSGVTSGVDDLVETVETTLRCRANCGLPHQYVVLNDWGDVGVLVMDTDRQTQEGEPAVLWIGYHDFTALCDGTPLSDDATVFPDFADYVVDRFDFVTS